MNDGQYNLPEWDMFRTMVDGIYERKYYTNHGPLVKKLEETLCNFFHVRHAVCMTNKDIALMISLLALDIENRVLIPAFAPVAVSQNVLWAGLKPVYCDMVGDHPNISVQSLQENLAHDVSAVIAIHNWGDSCDVDAIREFAAVNSLKVIYCSSDVIGQTYKGRPHGSNGDLEIFSFHETEMINGGDGACVTTNDDELAARLRNIRSSYGARHPVKIPYTGNGRMSEIQAGLILSTLNDLQENRHRNQKQVALYRDLLAKVRNINLFNPAEANAQLNFSKVILIHKEPGLHELKLALESIGLKNNSTLNYGIDCETLMPIKHTKNATSLKNSMIALPVGRLVNEEEISRICSTIKHATHGYS